MPFNVRWGKDDYVLQIKVIEEEETLAYLQGWLLVQNSPTRTAEMQKKMAGFEASMMVRSLKWDAINSLQKTYVTRKCRKVRTWGK
jgi:hypothetical protein